MLGFLVGFINTIFVSSVFTKKYLDEGDTKKYFLYTFLTAMVLNVIVLSLIELIKRG